MSGKTEHTQGEWMFQGIDPWNDASGNFVQWSAYRISARSLDREDADYYYIGTLSNVNDNAENEANARLIVAAPKLLKELIELRQQINDFCVQYGEADFYTGDATAAIALATGA